jgi:hypothetical protein
MAGMAYDVDRRPGAWVQEQTARRERRILLGIGLGLLITGAFLVLALGRHVSIGGSLAFLGGLLVVRQYGNRYVDLHLRLRRGTQAEVDVGATLEELRHEGWIVMHDLERPGSENIDHLVSGPNGVYLIETKANRYEERHLGRAKGQAHWLHDQLGVFVTPVICLRARRRKPFRHDKVWIVPHQELLDWLRAQRNHPVDFNRLARFADSL